MSAPVSIPLTDGASLRGALSMPEGDGTVPGVLVLHESFGLNDDIRRIADRFAANGYAALAPDLFSHGNRALCLSRVLLSGASEAAMDATMADIEASRRALETQPRVDAARIAVAGFCLGGGFALVFGARSDVKAAAVNYGSVPRSVSALDGVCPVVASYGARDRVFAPHVRRLRTHLESLGVPNDVLEYADAGHSFLSYDNAPAWLLRIPNPMQAGYSEDAAEDAWRRMLAFFAEHVA